jgi:hypothetical protein
MTNQKWFCLLRLIAYKLVAGGCWFMSFMNFAWWGVKDFLWLHMTYLALSILLPLVPKKSGPFGQSMVFLIALGNICMPFLGSLENFGEYNMVSFVFLFLTISPFVGLMLYYDLFVSLPKYRPAPRS